MSVYGERLDGDGPVVRDNSDGELEILVPPVLAERSVWLLVEGIVAHPYTPGEERSQVVVF